MEKISPRKPVNLLFAPNPTPVFGHMSGTVEKLSYVDKVKCFYDLGFRALECNEFASLPVDTQTAVAKEMERLGMKMGVFAQILGEWGKPSLTGNIVDTKSRRRDKEAVKRKVRATMELAVETAKRANAQWFTVVLGFEDPSLEYWYEFANVVEHLKYAADYLEKNNGPTMVLEALNRKELPSLWLKRIPQAYAVCKAVGSPKCKILDDLYHQQISEGNLIENIDAAWDEIAYFQIADNPARHEPGTGEINFKKIMEHISRKGYKGVIGLELKQSERTEAGDKFFVDSIRAIDVA